MARAAVIDLQHNPDGSLKIFLDGRDVSTEIRHPNITRLVSDISKIKEIREVLLSLQRRLGRQKDAVIDGRDIGTVVFPDAEKKFFLDAKIEERAKRRFKELQEADQQITLQDVEIDVRNRDIIDSTRACAPLKKAEDAICIDTTYMTIEEVVNTILNSL